MTQSPPCEGRRPVCSWPWFLLPLESLPVTPSTPQALSGYRWGHTEVSPSSRVTGLPSALLPNLPPVPAGISSTHFLKSLWILSLLLLILL